MNLKDRKKATDTASKRLETALNQAIEELKGEMPISAHWVQVHAAPYGHRVVLSFNGVVTLSAESDDD
jgi:hypothetical protein